MADIGQRKVDHLELCATDEVAFRGRTTLLECVQLVHQSLPELAYDGDRPSLRLLGKRLRAPILIAAMTGGSDASAEVNRELAAIAEARGYGFGLGSQRAMQRAPETAWTYEVRKHARPRCCSATSAWCRRASAAARRWRQLVADIGADALCVHMNPAMELVQPEGDRDFRGCLETFARLVRELPMPGRGQGDRQRDHAARPRARLRQRRRRSTSTCRARAARAGSASRRCARAARGARRVGEALWDWGVPTAASVAYARAAGLVVDRDRRHPQRARRRASDRARRQRRGHRAAGAAGAARRRPRRVPRRSSIASSASCAR